MGEIPLDKCSLVIVLRDVFMFITGRRFRAGGLGELEKSRTQAYVRLLY